MTIAALCRPLAQPCPRCGDLVVIFVDAPICHDCEDRERRAAEPPRPAPAPEPAPAPAARRRPRSVPDAIQSLFDEEAGPAPAPRRARGGRR